MVREYVRAGYEKIHLDASMRCADDPPGALPDEVVAARTAELAAASEKAASEKAASERPAGSPALVYVIGTEVPPPGGQAAGHAGPLATDVERAERSLRLTREAFESRGLSGAWRRVIAQVVQPGVEFGDDVVYGYRRDAAAGLRRWCESKGRLVFEAHSTDYQPEAALRALVEDRFAILKVGPELTFAYREAVFALEAVERELLERRAPESLSGARAALDRAMCADPRHWKAWYGDGDAETLRERRAWSLSDRARYYWPVPQVQQAVERLFANLDAVRLPQGLASQYLPWACEAADGAPRPGRASSVARLRVRRVLARYARAVAGSRPVAEGARLSL
jgi:D-tagatose-1,6-bisphosphate aldolase subunit GatZ/KbaZ